MFLCVANSARSQIAEGLAKGKPFFSEVESAGSAPSGAVRPLAVAAMKEVGIDISGHTSKDMADFDLNAFDAVVTLCAEERCPVVLLKEKAKHLHWPFADPAGDFPGESEEQKLDRFRKARDDINAKLDAFVAQQTSGGKQI